MTYKRYQYNLIVPDKVPLTKSSKVTMTPIEEFDIMKKAADKEYEDNLQGRYLTRSKHEHGARPVIKAQLEARIAKGWVNDWKVKFLYDKLDMSNAIIGKLKSLIR